MDSPLWDSMDIDHSLPFDADPAQPGVTAAPGRRPDSPQFTADPMVDRLYGVTLALVAELAVTRTRLDTLERVLAGRGVVGEADIDQYRADELAQEQRSQLHAEYLARVLRALD